MLDKKVICKECGQEFVFTANEQQFYAEHHLTEPKRCKKCRDAKRIKNSQDHKNNFSKAA